MKKSALLTLGLFLLLTVQAQVQVRPLPEPGYDLRIRDFVNNMKIVDTHEHLGNPAGFKNSGKLDFMMLLFHYADDDIKSAGMSKQGFQKLLTDSLTVMEKWNAIKPYWEGSSNTAYNRAALLTADKLFGVKNIDETTVVELSDKIRKAYQTDWYNTVLKDKCNIEYVVNDSEDRSFGDPKMFRYVKRFGEFFFATSPKKIEAIEKQQDYEIKTLDDFASALAIAFHKAMDNDFVAVKVGIAYERSLLFEDVSKEKAEEVFNKIMALPKNDGLQYNGSEIKPLQDYMMHRLLDLARATNTPVEFHTGLQSGDGNIIENANPALLANLFLKYRTVKFILFHGGYPFGGELSTLAKNFRNVYLDMCWLYIISPSYSERYLHEWLETVPANKIMAFGGDFLNVEGIYGHLLFARQVVANVLIAKVKDGYFTEAEALKIAQMILHDNAIQLLKLDQQVPK